MIYLIGGPPRCGKTVIAKDLAGTTGFSWCPTDYLGSVVSQYIAEDEYPARFPLGHLRRVQERSNDRLYSQHTANEIIGLYQTQAQTVWAGLRAFLEYAAVTKQDFVLDGYQIQPRLIHSLSRHELYADIRAVFIYRTDERAILEGFQHGGSPDDWVARNTEDEKTLPKVARMVIEYGKHFHSEAEKYSFRSFDMDVGFEKQKEAVFAYLMGDGG